MPVILYSAAVLSLFNLGGWIPGIAAGAAFCTIMMGGDIYVNNPENQRLAMFNFVLQDPKKYYTGMIILESVLALLAFRLAVPRVLLNSSPKLRLFRNIILFSFLVVLPFASLGLIKV